MSGLHNSEGNSGQEIIAGSRGVYTKLWSLSAILAGNSFSALVQTSAKSCASEPYWLLPGCL